MKLSALAVTLLVVGGLDSGCDPGRTRALPPSS